MSEEARAVAAARRGYVVAPAGCGKTHLIARATATKFKGRRLILTHTHAGVAALRRRLHDLRVPPRSYTVETIAGWALRYASSFPRLSGMSVPEPSGDDWNLVYAAARDALERRVVRRVVEVSYTGLFVDEYQDCVKEQHQLVLRLCELLPCCVFGDPLQGIFRFKGNDPVDWASDVEGNFELCAMDSRPWRWDGKNEALGSWLLRAREDFLKGRSIDLHRAPVTWLPATRENGMKACRSAARTPDQTAVALAQWAAGCHKIASQLGGLYVVAEPIECRELADAARRIGATSGTNRALSVIDFAAACMTKLKATLKSVRGALAGAKPFRGQKHKDLYGRLSDVASDGSLLAVKQALKALRGIKGVVLYRRELFNEMIRAIDEFATGRYPTLGDAAWHSRNRSRHVARNPRGCVVSRTLLAKGLEYDHVVVMDADKLNRENLYVAMTRGSRTLTILSQRSHLSPPGSD